MGGRYLVTGVQLGILKTTANRSPEEMGKTAMELVDEIIETQGVGDSVNEITEDVADVATYRLLNLSADEDIASLDKTLIQ